MNNEQLFDALGFFDQVYRQLDAMSKRHLRAMPEERRNRAFADLARKSTPQPLWAALDVCISQHLPVRLAV